LYSRFYPARSCSVVLVLDRRLAATHVLGDAEPKEGRRACHVGDHDEHTGDRADDHGEQRGQETGTKYERKREDERLHHLDDRAGGEVLREVVGPEPQR
jgi:hypothetical protein